MIGDENTATRPASPVLYWTALAVALAMSLYHMYVAAFGPPEAMIFRGTHLLFALTLVFLLFPLRPDASAAWRLLDLSEANGTPVDLVIATKLGKAIRFGEKDIRPMGRTAAGVRGLTLGKKDEVIGMVACGPDDKFIFTAAEKGYGKKTEIDLYRKTRRGGKGITNLKVTPKIGNAMGLLGVGEDDLLIVTVSGKVIRIKTSQVRASGRATQGVRLINLEENDRICSVAKAGESE